MKLYEFDAIDSSLKLIPLAARRALDALGLKLSLRAFHGLPLEARRKLVTAGSGTEVDLAGARDAIEGADPKPSGVEIIVEPSRDSPPDDVVSAFGPEQPLSDKVWQSLSHLDRYVICKVARRGKKERMRAAYDEIVGAQSVSTHLRPEGGVHMVSVAEKPATLRHALAECWVTMSADAFSRLTSAKSPKGDVLATARVAGIMATKRTSDLIPLCHPLGLLHAEVDFEEHKKENKLRVTCSVTVHARTGVEMEAMVGVNIAALTVYDMLKSVDRSMQLGPCRLLEKTGGRSGSFRAED